jgi:UDP:flavonoid glycosyltransferase YjiC (YdhE family)
MINKHIAFVLEQAYGHIIPSVGLALGLMRRGYRVSYAVTDNFAPSIIRLGAKPVVFRPLKYREEILAAYVENDTKKVEDLRSVRTVHSVAQLDALYHDDRPDLIIQDDCEDSSGRALAEKLGIKQIRFCPSLTDSSDEGWFVGDELVLVPVPRLFVRGADKLSERIRLIGFNPEGRRQFFEPWNGSDSSNKTILVSVTTGSIPQIDFCKLAIGAFRDENVNVVLSIGGLDGNSAFEPLLLGDIPRNIWLNRTSSNLDILEYACLYVGQGGQGSTLEALYSGVPVLVIPASPFYEPVASRVTELGVGARIDPARISESALGAQCKTILDDMDILRRVKETQEVMQRNGDAEAALDLIDEYL